MEMINSGSLKDIGNPRLRILLTNWISNIEDIAKQEMMLANERDKILNMFRSEENSIKTLYDLTGVSSELEIPLSSDRTSNRNLLKSKEFENNMLMFILTSIKTETLHYNPLMQSIDEILKTIDNEIKE
jgi:tRNA G26 N,N-dimethylase Trm1